MVEIQGNMPPDPQKSEAEKDAAVKKSLGRIKNKIIVIDSRYRANGNQHQRGPAQHNGMEEVPVNGYLYPDYKSTALRSPTKPLVPLRQTLSELTGPVFSPDGQRLYFSSQRGRDGRGMVIGLLGAPRWASAHASANGISISTCLPARMQSIA